MTRIVLEIRYNALEKTFLASLTEPANYSGAYQMYPFCYDPHDDVPAQFTIGTLGTDKMGEYIVEKLFGNPAIECALNRALEASDGTEEPVYIQIAPQHAEVVPWETLFAKGRFLALDPRWPIGRMCMSRPLEGGAHSREFRPPLRVLAVLAAAGLKASQEWAELRDALGKLPFGAEVRVLAAEDALITAAAAGNPPNLTVTAEFVEPGLDLPAQITGFRPNVLHFFCHGGVEAGSTFLEIATRSTVSKPRGGVVFELKDFPVVQRGGDLWLVVLNACKGAQPPRGAASLVSSLAAQGVPAVAGMREAVTQLDAHAFCRGFYQALALMLTPLGSPFTPVTIAWPAALYRARREICELHRGPDICAAVAPRLREWTLPVMYVGVAPFKLHRAPPVWHFAPPPPLPTAQRIALESQLQILRDLVRRQLGAPPEVIAAYLGHIEDLEIRLAG